MRTSTLTGTVALLLVGLAGQAFADVLVDTGPVSQLHHNVSLFNSRPGSPLYQFLAGKFSLGQAFNISSIEGLMYPPNGKLAVKLYNDVAGKPGTPLFTRDFQFPQSPTPVWAVAGPSLNWERPAGTYWVSFEPHNGSDFGGMPGVVQHPLMNYAVLTESSGGWSLFPGMGVGVRINGVFVPEPGTVVLLFVALGSLATSIRRRHP